MITCKYLPYNTADPKACCTVAFCCAALVIALCAAEAGAFVVLVLCRLALIILKCHNIEQRYHSWN